MGVSRAEYDAALRLVWGLRDLWERRHHYREARAYVARVLAEAGPIVRTLARARVLSLKSQSWFHDPQYDARPMLREALAIAVELGDEEFQAHTLFTLGCNSSHLRDYPAEVEYFERSLAIFQELGRKVDIRRQTAFTGDGYYDLGDYTRAKGYYREALRMSDEVGSELDQVRALLGLGQVALHEGDLAMAETHIHEGFTINQAAGKPHHVIFVIEAFINFAVAKGELIRATRSLSARTAMLKEMSLPIQPYYYPDTEASRNAMREKLDEAIFANAWAEGRAMTQEQVLEYASARRSEVEDWLWTAAL